MRISVSEMSYVSACAKVNLTLELLGGRDDGYHEIRTILQSIGLEDKLYFEYASSVNVTCSVQELENERNLVYRATCLLQKRSGCHRGVKIFVEKGIPIGMGLGGGSSDAAQTLVALDRLWELGLGRDGLLPIAADLGSDVPFFLTGGTALGEGRGDEITLLRSLPEMWLVLLCPPMVLPEKTARMYSLLTDQNASDGAVVDGAIECINNGYFNEKYLYNVFENVVSKVYKGFDSLIEDFIQAGAPRVSLSGSGPALFSFVKNKTEGEVLCEALQEKGFLAYLIRTVTRE